ncbi:MAG: hypothetical protein CVT84_16765, partial [Alphaproteobacteria bacterium HGW-Alphaproteobacteria-6]
MRRLLALFARYCAHHLILPRPGPVLRDRAGACVGRVGHVTLHGNRIVVTGWAGAGDRVTIEDDQGHRSGVHADLAAGEGAAPGAAGFTVTLPCHPRALGISLDTAGGEIRAALALPGRLAIGLARAALLPGFAARLVRAAPL